MKQDKQKTFFSLLSLKLNKFQKSKKTKKLLLEPSFIMEKDKNNNQNHNNKGNDKKNTNLITITIAMINLPD